MENKNSNSVFIIILAFILALTSPLFLLPVEKVLPYPYVIEEILKAVFVVLAFKLSERKMQMETVFFAVFLFAFSENAFYLANFISSGSLHFFAERFALATIFHISTAAIIFFPVRKKFSLIFPCLALAILLHYLYNQNISTIITYVF